MATGRRPGRPSKPAEVKKQEGNLGKRKIPEPLIQANAIEGVPVIPETLGEHGTDLWNNVWSTGAAWMNTEVDYFLVQMLCEAWDELTLMRQSLALGSHAGGVDRTYKMRNDAIVSHPFVSQVKDLRVQITAWLSVLAFTPTDRVRLGVLADTIGEDPMEKLLLLKKKRLEAIQKSSEATDEGN